MKRLLSTALAITAAIATATPVLATPYKLGYESKTPNWGLKNCTKLKSYKLYNPQTKDYFYFKAGSIEKLQACSSHILRAQVNGYLVGFQGTAKPQRFYYHWSYADNALSRGQIATLTKQTGISRSSLALMDFTPKGGYSMY